MFLLLSRTAPTPISEPDDEVLEEYSELMLEYKSQQKVVKDQKKKKADVVQLPEDDDESEDEGEEEPNEPEQTEEEARREDLRQLLESLAEDDINLQLHQALQNAPPASEFQW